MKNNNRNTAADPFIIFFALFNIIFHLVFINNLEYHRDELLYFSLGLHPSAGYATVPPLIGWLAWVMQNIFGYSVFAVRLLPALVSGIMIVLAASMAKELGGSNYSSRIAAIGLTISVFFMRTYSLFQPVFLEVFLLTLCIYLIIKYINSGKGKFIILFGITAGITLLNKYLAGIYFIGLLAIIPFTRHRQIFHKKDFWMGLALGFVAFMPNLIWQVANGFPVFNHMSELYRTQLVHMDIPLFLTEQLLMPFTGTAFTIAGILFLLFNKKAEKFRFLGFMSVFVIAALMLLKGKSYYTLGVFPLLIVSGAVGYDHWIKNKRVRILIPVVLVVLTVPVVPMGVAIFKPAGMVTYFKRLHEKYKIDVGTRFEDGSIHSLPQDYADMLGWEQLASLTNTAYRMVPDVKACFIYCENYGQAGAITIIGKKYNLPEAVCFSESFRYWIPRSFNPDIKSLIYINDEPGEDVKTFFGKITKIGSIDNVDAREYGTAVYLCENPAGSFNEFWIKRISSFF